MPDSYATPEQYRTPERYRWPDAYDTPDTYAWPGKSTDPPLPPAGLGYTALYTTGY